MTSDMHICKLSAQYSIVKVSASLPMKNLVGTGRTTICVRPSGAIRSVNGWPGRGNDEGKASTRLHCDSLVSRGQAGSSTHA